MSPRRVTGAEEQELLDAQAAVRAAQSEADRRLAERDRLIAELLDANARVVDIADVLGLTPKAVRDARTRAR